MNMEEALKKSIRHWLYNEQTLNHRTVDVGASSCALCELFYWDRDCVGCPVFEHTQTPRCKGTPYYDAHDALGNWADADGFLEEWRCREEFKIRARDMRLFLERLLCSTSLES